MVKLFVIVVYEASWYFIVSVCVPTLDVELVENVRIGEPVLVETVTKAGVAPLSSSVTVVEPQIEAVVDVPNYLFNESSKKGYSTVFELPR